MNKVYRTVFNAATGTWAVASELAKGRKKSSKSAVAIAAAALLALPAGAAFAADDAEEDDTVEPKMVALSDVGAPRTMGVMSSGATIMAGPGDYAAGGGVIDPNVAGGNNTAIGANSHIAGNSASDISNATAIGGATVNNAGVGAMATGAIGIGAGASANGNNSIVIGARAVNGNSNAISIGADSTSRGGNGTVALGTGATVTSSGGAAIGGNSRVTGANSAALGQGTGTSRANAFSVGNDVLGSNPDGSTRTAFTRQIVNVADATQTNDAVNLGQMNTALSTKVDTARVQVGGAGTATVSGLAGNVAIGSGAQSTSGTVMSSVALGENARATNMAAVALGTNANASGSAATALGQNAQATHAAATAIGTASATDRDNSVSVGNAATNTYRQITNVAAGTLDNDAVNLGQMNTALSTKVDDTYVKVNSSAAAATAAGSNAVAIGGASSAGGVGAVAVGQGATASIGGAVALGQSANAIGDTSTAIGYQSRAEANRSIALGSGANVNASADYGVALGRTAQVTATGVNSVALGQASIADRANTVSVGSATQQRQITNMAAGTAATDAVNISQLTPVVNALGGGATINADGSVTGPTYNLANGTGTPATTIGDALGQLDGALTTTNGRVGDLETQLGSGTIGLVQQAGAGQKLTVGKDTDGTEVDFTGTAGERKLTGVAAGAVAAGSTEAINGSQLHAVSTSVADAIGAGSAVNPDGSITAPSFTVGDGSGGTKVVNNVGDAVTNLNTRVTGNETAIGDIRSELGSGTVGLVQQDATSRNLTVGKDTDGAEVDFSGTTGTRKLTGVAAGAVVAGSTEAINGSQLHAVSSSVADAIGAGSTVNPDGSITAPSFTVGDGSGGMTVVRNVGDAVSNLDGRVITNETAIGDIRSELGSGAVGLVQQDATSRNLTVGKDTDGAEVDFSGTTGTRKLTGVAAGVNDTDAVNMSQLNATNTNVSNLTTRVGTAEGDITTINTKLAGLESGGVGLVQQATPTGSVTVAAASGGTAVDFKGTDGVRVLSGIGAGIGNNDAVSVGQLKSVIGYNIVDPLDPLMAVRYDDASMSSVTFGGDPLFGTVLNNVGPGLIASGSMQAVNGGQLFDMQAKYDGLIGALDGRVGAIESGIADGSIGGPGTGTPEGSVPSPGKGEGSTAVGAGSSADGKNSSAVGAGSSASGDNGSAIGNGAVASGNNGTAVGQGSSASAEGSTAIGQGASSSHAGSVAIGQGSTTTRENEVSFGSAGNERILSNVADGVRDTDAVNVRQMNNAIGGLNNKIDSNHRDAMGGVAAAMAVAGLPQSSMPGKTFMAIAGSTYGGEQGTAIGASYMSQNGKWVVKGAMNTSTRGEVGAVVGGGFYW